VHEVEHITAKHWAEKAYKAGWNAAKGQLDTTLDATRDTNATNYANNPPGGFQLVHSTY
jgi:hypothetical protein